MIEIPLTIVTSNGEREVLAHTWEHAPGLAIHKDTIFSGWVVTHVVSGHRIRRDWRYKREAVALLNKLAPLADWTQPRDVLIALPGLQVAVDAMVTDVENGA